MKHKLSRLGVGILVAGLLGACSLQMPTTRFSELSVGISKSRAIEILGEPYKVRATQDAEYLVYKTLSPNAQARCAGFRAMTFGLGAIACGVAASTYFVKIVDAKVEAHGRASKFASIKEP